MSIGQLNLGSAVWTCSSRNTAAVMRQKRERGQYQKVIYLEPILVGQDNHSSLSSPVGFIMCPTKETNLHPSS